MEPPLISPDGSMCFRREVVYGVGGRSYATLVDREGYEIPLPGSDVGQASWSGTKLLWHSVEREYNDETEDFTVVKNSIYIYETLDHTYTEIAVDIPESSCSGVPVLTSANEVAVVFPDGLWTYDLTEQSWTHAAAFQAEMEDELVWSPDMKKVVWHEADEDQDKFILLDIDSGNIITIHQQPVLEMDETVSKLQPFIHMAWSSDSTKIAVSGGSEEDILILSLEGEVLNSISALDHIASLSWVPDQDKVAYATIDALNIADAGDDSQRLVNLRVFRHTWLPNGNLVNLDESEGIEIYQIDWED